MDGSAKIFKENRTAQNGPSLGETAVTEFRVRCFGGDVGCQTRACFIVRAISSLRLNLQEAGSRRSNNSSQVMAERLGAKLAHKMLKHRVFWSG